LYALYVNEKAPLVITGDVSFEGGGLLVVALEETPALLAPGPVDGDDDLSLGRFGLKDVDQGLIAYLRDLGGVRAQGLHLVGGDDTFGLRADVDQKALAVFTHHNAFDDVTTAKGRVAKALLFKESLHVLSGAISGAVT
jgi:hypothetical protein